MGYATYFTFKMYALYPLIDQSNVSHIVSYLRKSWVYLLSRSKGCIAWMSKWAIHFGMTK
jgi:hypothetical protein